MKEQFVPLYIALKLKELGFDEQCLAYSFIGNTGTNVDTFHIDHDCLYWNHKEMCIAHPLWQQVFDWFRNKKVLIEVSAIDDWNYWSATIYMEDCMSPFFVAFQDNEYEASTYEEAREYSILKAIELLTK